MQKRKSKFSLKQEKNFYENQWNEVFNECMFLGIINKEKIVSAMHNLNIIDIKIIEERNEKKKNLWITKEKRES